MRKLDLWYPGSYLEAIATCFLFCVGWQLGVLAFGYFRDSPMEPVITYGRVAMSEGGFLVQEVTEQHFDGSGELIKEEKKWEMIRRLTPKETFYLKGVDTNPDMVKDMSVPGAQLRKS